MSLVSDMLSKVKIAPPKRETPPGLKSDMNQARRKKVEKKYKIGLVLSIIIAFMIIVSAYLRMIYIAKEGAGVPENLHQLKAKRNERLYTKTEKQESLSDKIHEALKTVPKKEEKAVTSNKTDIVAVTPPPDLLSTASNQSDRSEQAKTDSSGSSEKTVAAKERKTVDKNEVAPIEEKKEPEIGSKETYHYLYKASKSEKENDYLGAISVYNKILEAEPTNYIVMNKVASLLMKMNMWKESMDQLRKSYSINKKYVPTLINIGIVYASTENYSTSEKYFQKALTLDPINQDAIFSIALLYEKQNMNDKATEYYSMLRKLGDARGSSGLERILSY